MFRCIWVVEPYGGYYRQSTLLDALWTKHATDLLSNWSGANSVESCMDGSANSSDCFHRRLLEKTSSTEASPSMAVVEVERAKWWGMTPKVGRGSGPWRLPRLFLQRVRDFPHQLSLTRQSIHRRLCLRARRQKPVRLRPHSATPSQKHHRTLGSRNRKMMCSTRPGPTSRRRSSSRA
jgi:hypothetical protein